MDKENLKVIDIGKMEEDEVMPFLCVFLTDMLPNAGLDAEFILVVKKKGRGTGMYSTYSEEEAMKVMKKMVDTPADTSTKFQTCIKDFEQGKVN